MMRKIMTTMTLALLTIGLLTGCTSTAKEDDREHAVALVLGVHANSRELNFNNAVLAETLMQADYVSLVVNDGTPDVVDKRGFVLPDQYKGASKTLLNEQAKKRSMGLLYEASQLRADSDESDPLEALRTAANSVNSIGTDATRTVYVMDTGLQTSGYLKMNDGILNTDAAQVADALAQRGLVPDLSGIRVMWQHMGDTDYPQNPLSPRHKTALENLWRAIVEKGGGTYECIDEDPNSGGYIDGYPKVTPIVLSDEQPIDIAIATEQGITFDAPIYMGEEMVRFLGDSAEYAEPEKAIDVLTPIVGYMKSTDGFRLLLCGTTAGDEDSEFAQRLSKDRAEAVRNTLILLGADGERIQAIGLGSHDRWHISGVGTSGELAAKNRKVVLLDADSDLGIQVWKESR